MVQSVTVAQEGRCKHPGGVVGWWVAASLVLSGCASAPTKPAAPVAAPASPASPAPTAAVGVSAQAPARAELAVLMQKAQAAIDAAQPSQARALWREAASAYPTEKLPWMRLAEDAFSRGDHGHAILAAQEVLQRDPADGEAHRIAVISGLRVAAPSVQALGKDRSGLQAAPLAEAAQLAQRVRDDFSAALGASALAGGTNTLPALAGRARAGGGVSPAAAGASARSDTSSSALRQPATDRPVAARNTTLPVPAPVSATPSRGPDPLRALAATSPSAPVPAAQLSAVPVSAAPAGATSAAVAPTVKPAATAPVAPAPVARGPGAPSTAQPGGAATRPVTSPAPPASPGRADPFRVLN